MKCSNPLQNSRLIGICPVVITPNCSRYQAHSQVLRFGVQIHFSGARLFFIICIKHLFLGTAQFEGAQKYLGGNALRGYGPGRYTIKMGNRFVPWFISFAPNHLACLCSEDSQENNENTFIFFIGNWGSQTRSVTSLRYQTGRRFFWEGPNFFNYVQHIFPGETKSF